MTPPNRATDRPAFHFIHPGPVSQMSGGTLYDLRVIDELRQSGWDIELHALPGRFPLVNATATEAAARVLSSFPAGAVVVVDGLALPAFDEILEQHAGRLAVMALAHHPTADETGLSERESARLYAIEKRLFGMLRGILVPSPAMVRRLADYGVPADRIRVVKPGVDPAPRSRGSAGMPAALLCVASLTPRKGHVALLEALADCSDLDWRLVCAGPTDSDPATTKAIEATIRRLGLSDRVSLLGSQVGADLDALYDAADIFVLASRYEGYGMVFAEAMARGLPILASGAGAVADTVPEAAGIVVPVGDRAALAAAARCLISNSAFRRQKADGSWEAGKSLPRWRETAARFGQAVTAMRTT